MAYVLGVLAIFFVIALVAGAITGRVKARSCCTVVPPERDARMLQ